MSSESNNHNLARFLLIFFLGWIGSIIINHTSLRPKGWKSRTCGLFFWSLLTFGIYWLVVSIANLAFDANRVDTYKQIGYFKVAE